MRFDVQRACLFGLLFASAGCMTPWNTRFPTFYRDPPEVERQSYERFDPFPDEELGPDTMTRPRSFIDQRDMPRRAAEGRMWQGAEPQLGPAAPLPPSAGEYPNAVPH